MADGTLTTRSGVALKATSNCIIVDGARVLLPDSMLAAGFTASNYLDDNEPHFSFRRRSRPLSLFVEHETCGNTAVGVKNTLLRNDYGVQLILAPDGHVSCHGDLARDRMVHANQCNDYSIGMEVVNPYSRLYARPPFGEFEPPQWWTWTPSAKQPDVAALLKAKGLTAVPRGYVLPLPAQVDANRLLVPWVCGLVGIPIAFPTAGLNAKHRRVAGVPAPGIIAHQDIITARPHADGRYLLERLMAEVLT